MTPVSQANPARPMAAAGGIPGTPRPRQAGEEAPNRPPEPVTDQYVHREKPEPSGLYRLGSSGEGQPRLYFDGPETPGSPERDAQAGAPEKGGPAQKAERCTGDTGAVDREIEQLKQRRAELERQLDAETDGARAQERSGSWPRWRRSFGKRTTTATGAVTPRFPDAQPGAGRAERQNLSARLAFSPVFCYN